MQKPRKEDEGQGRLKGKNKCKMEPVVELLAVDILLKVPMDLSRCIQARRSYIVTSSQFGQGKRLLEWAYMMAFVKDVKGLGKILLKCSFHSLKCEPSSPI